MNKRSKPDIQLSELRGSPQERQAYFTLMVLGLIDLLEKGDLSPLDALCAFFHGENLRFARRSFRNKLVDEVMERGNQLDDLFDILSPRDARRAFTRELATMRSICLKLAHNKTQAIKTRAAKVRKAA